MLYRDCFFCFDYDWFAFVIIVAIRFLTSAYELFIDVMFDLSSSLYVFMFVLAFFLKVLNPFYSLDD